MDSDFDVIILGTGLTESITAAALSKAGFKVAHIDSNPYYGADDASLSLDELVQWADDRSISRSSSTLPHARQYSLSLSPSLIPSVGPFVSSLVSSGVSRYGGFRLLERVAIYDPSGNVKHVPKSKEDVFKNKDFTLIDKRRLMRFLMFATGEFEGKEELIGNEQVPFYKFLQKTFSLNEDMANVIAYSLAYCTLASDPTLPTLQRLRRYLRSAGRYGTSSFLVGHYGGLGEIAQGFCRSCAVSGGVYILGKDIVSIDQEPKLHSSHESLATESRYILKLDDFPQDLTCHLIISSKNHVPSHLGHAVKYMPPSDLSPSPATAIARCIAIIDGPISLLSELTTTSSLAAEDPESPPLNGDDTSVLIFPPSSLATGTSTTSVNVLITGEGSKSAPQGKLIVYLSTLLIEPVTVTPESLLKPYLDATLSLARRSGSPPIETHFTIFYNQELSHHTPSLTHNNPTSSTFLVTPVTSWLLPESPDSAAANAEAVFWEAIEVLQSSRSRQTSSNPDCDSVGYPGTNLSSFWPPIDLYVEEG